VAKDARSPTLGYALSSEEHPPSDLVRHAAMAEEHGFEYALISDHFHPWTERQGESSFVWTVIGAIVGATRRLRLGTGVTCPMIRIHPAIVAQASATAAALMPGRFFLGVGTGENLNEHVLGDRWPPSEVRREMLDEAISIIRALWDGEEISHRGRHYTVENARLFTRPDVTPPLLVAASGERAAELAGRWGDGLIVTGPDAALIKAFRDARASASSDRGDDDAPVYGQLTVCWAPDEAAARATALEWWPTAALHGELTVELPLPAHFEQATTDTTEDQVAARIVCGPDPDRHLKAIAEYVEAGIDHVYVHQVGPDQVGFMRFYADEVMPRLTSWPEMATAGRSAA
jgi:G6PDH family F420-dependent oxidoreductase